MHRGFKKESNRSAPRPFRFRPVVVAVAVLLVAAACGPSVQSIYEGNVRFEHCYRLDLEVNTAPTHRAACWNEWLNLYTYGQPRDRIDYARRRAHAFTVGDIDRPKLEVSEAKKKEETRQFYLVLPAPTSAHAPPPPVATRYYADPATAPSVVSGAGAVSDAGAPERKEAPGAQCSSTCRGILDGCTTSCATDAGKNDPGCMSCGQDYKRCMKRCFQ